MKRIVIKDLDDLGRAAQEFLEITSGYRKFAMSGSMGAGKTTFIKSLCYTLGSIDTVTSPTFTLVNEYFTEQGESIYHFDFYRIKKIEEIYDFGFDEYIESPNYCFMEWPELVEEALPPEVISIRITVEKDLSRTVDIYI
jgi:tRNA threonylcarbamoyladenosine biosynthesis protein TsaE